MRSSQLNPTRNIIDEATKKAVGETLDILKKIQDTVLNKTTLRSSGYRKALIFFHNSLRQCISPNIEILDLFRTATDISEIMYAPDSKHMPKEILRFHNLTYQHGKLYSVLEQKSCLWQLFSLNYMPFPTFVTNNHFALCQHRSTRAYIWTGKADHEEYFLFTT